MAAYYTVQQGECLTSIAAANGFADYRIIYDHPENADFRAKRPDPNLIFPGDVIYIPDKQDKAVNVATTAIHRFQIASGKRVLRIVVQGPDGKPMPNEPYELQIEGQVYTKQTDGNGLLQHSIPVDAASGSLKIRNYMWPLGIAQLNPLENVPDDGISGIQARLRNLGFDPGPIDGEKGPLTEAAIRAFQAANPPLDVDGICGPQTRAKLVERYGC